MKAVIPPLLLLLGMAGSAGAQPFERHAASNLDACLEKLNAQDGGWCEIRGSARHPSISSVWPRGLDKKTRMRTGPRSVLIAWNGAAFDEQELLMYFTGGGHADYGGNEVYEFDLRAGKWTRITDPSPLEYLHVNIPDHSPSKSIFCWTTDSRREPPAGHTYDGLQFSKVTRTIFVVAWSFADGSCFADDKDAFDDSGRLVEFRPSIFEFNPSATEARHGIDPLSWRLVNDETPDVSYPRFLELPDGQMLLGNRTAMHAFDPMTGVIGQRLWSEADGGDGVAEYHPRGWALLLKRWIYLVQDLKTGLVRQSPAPRDHGKSLAVRRDGTVFSWDGKDRILVQDPSRSDSEWILYDWSENGPQAGDRGRVYSKWQYIADLDVFVGLSDSSTGVWIYKHPSTMAGKAP